MTDEEIVAALAEHRLTTPRQCLCGWRQEGEWSDAAHAEHLLPVVRRVAEQRAAEELEAVAVGHDARDLHAACFARAAALTATDHERNAT